MTGSKLGWHFQKTTNWMKRVVNSAYAKVLDPPEDNVFPRSKTIGRVVNAGNGIIMDTGAEGRYIEAREEGAVAYYNACLPSYKRAPWVYAWEGPNEPVVDTAAQRNNLVAFTLTWIDLMHKTRLDPTTNSGLRTCALQLSERRPDDGIMPVFGPVMNATDLWNQHFYGPTPIDKNSEGMILRYRQLAEELRVYGYRVPPLFISETGMDLTTIGLGRKGWQTVTNWESYFEQLKWLDTELRRDDYVVGSAIFTEGPTWQWVTYELGEKRSIELGGYIEGVPEDKPPVILPPPGKSLEDVIHEEIQNVIVPNNPSAALGNAGKARGFVAVSPEMPVSYEGIDYLAQAFRVPSEYFVQHIAYARMHDWGNIKWFSRDD